jgi:hypothetical protein
MSQIYWFHHFHPNLEDLNTLTRLNKLWGMVADLSARTQIIASSNAKKKFSFIRIATVAKSNMLGLTLVGY